MSELMASLAAWATVAGLSIWCVAVPTRALGEPRCPRARAATTCALLVVAQSACAIMAAGLVGGFAVVASAWMLLGWPFGMALNIWPARTRQWSRASGLAALAGAALLAALGALP